MHGLQKKSFIKLQIIGSSRNFSLWRYSTSGSMILVAVSRIHSSLDQSTSPPAL